MRLRYSAVLDNTSEFLMFLSPTGLVLGASKSALAPLGQSMEFVVGQQWWETRWWPKSERIALMDGVRRASVGEVAKFSTARYDADGQVVPVTVTIAPVRDENGQVALLLPTVHDV